MSDNMDKKKKDVKVRHPCVYLGDRGIDCTNPQMKMRCDDQTAYDTTPDDCVECLLANILVQLGMRTTRTAYIREKEW